LVAVVEVVLNLLMPPAAEALEHFIIITIILLQMGLILLLSVLVE